MDEAEAPDPRSTVPERLRTLLALPAEQWSPTRLWRASSPRLRAEIVEAFLESDQADGALGDLLLDQLAPAAGFRRQTLHRLAPAEVARHAGRLPAPPAPLALALYQVYLTARHPDLLGAYLDAAGVDHENGVARKDGIELEEATARRAADSLAGAFPPERIAFYLVALHFLSPDLVPGLDRWLRSRLVAPTPDGQDRREDRPGGAGGEEDARAGDGAGAVSEEPDPEIVTEAREAAGEEASAPGGPFTALDNLLIRAAVDSAQAVEGALSPAEIEDLVGELLALNGSRHRSYFHRGFADVLFDRGWADSLLAESASRRRWYLAGAITGLARKRSYDEVADLFDEVSDVGRFGEGADDPARLAAPLVLDALCRMDRASEAAGFLTPGAVRANPLLLPPLLEEGTRLLRRDRAERARPFFDLLGEVVRELEAEGEPVTEPFFLQVRRRRAHCYRQLGDSERARALLERLLEEDPSPDVQAMVHADLGLLHGGYRSLAEVELWRVERDRADVEERLGQGEAHYRAAAVIRSRFAAHGRWPLGVLALARDEVEEAQEHLNEALSSFEARPGRYEDRSLLARVRTAAGIAGALTVTGAQQLATRDALVEGLEGGGRIPPDLVGDVLAAFEAGDAELGTEVLRAILDRGQGDLLDRLAATDTARRTPAAAHALLRRADEENRAQHRNAADLRTAVRLLLSPGMPEPGEAIDEARRALDRLEELAREGTGRDEFLEMLSHPEELSAAWPPEWVELSRLGLLEAAGRYEEAHGVGRKLFHRVLARRSAEAADEAEALLSRLAGFGLGEEWDRPLRDRLEAYHREEGYVEPPPLPEVHEQRVLAKVLIVGGDARNHALEDRVREELGKDARHIRVSHQAPGWSGNWSHALERAVAEARESDAVVLLTFTRTEFARALRSALDVPWVGCPGVGTDQVTRAVRRAAEWGMSRKRGG